MKTTATKIKKKQELLVFIADFYWQHNLAKSAGCDYFDTILAFWLLEAANMSENYEKIVLTVVDFEKGNLTDQMKASLKKFQGRALVLAEKEEIKFNSALMIKMKDALVAQGWKRPEK